MTAALGPEAILHTGKPTQSTRVKRAWQATQRLGASNIACNTAKSIWTRLIYQPDRAQILKRAKSQFWERYRMIYPTEVAPADGLLFRCYREMENHSLTCYDIRRVETEPEDIQGNSKSKRRKKRKERARAISITHGTQEHMAKLHTYLLALSIIGSDKVQGAPPEEEFGSDSTMFVQAPWDVLQSYYFRAAHAITAVPEASRLAWLERKDIRERRVWVNRIRSGNESLGEVVKSVMEERQAYWDYPRQSRARSTKHSLTQQLMASQESQQEAATPAVATTSTQGADEDEARHSPSIIATPTDSSPRHQQEHAQRLANLFKYHKDRSDTSHLGANA